MTAATKDIVIEKGAKFTQKLKWRDSKKKPVSLNGYSGRMHIRETVTSPDIVIELTSDNGGVSIEPNADTGVIEIFIGATTTQAVSVESGFYDLEIYHDVDPDDVVRLLEGAVEFKPEVTR